jgi:hypothetical protein
VRQKNFDYLSLSLKTEATISTMRFLIFAKKKQKGEKEEIFWRKHAEQI